MIVSILVSRLLNRKRTTIKNFTANKNRDEMNSTFQEAEDIEWHPIERGEK
ncbi:MAG: hypothetical protein N2450_09335 [bacterium]|nr:hypothetical protein [bacterium]